MPGLLEVVDVFICAALLFGCRFHLHLTHRADFGLGPRPVAEIGHKPDMDVFGATGVAPQWDGVEDDVVGVEGEFDIGEGLRRGYYCSVEAVESREFAGVDTTLFRDDI